MKKIPPQNQNTSPEPDIKKPLASLELDRYFSSDSDDDDSDHDGTQTPDRKMVKDKLQDDNVADIMPDPSASESLNNTPDSQASTASLTTTPDSIDDRQLALTLFPAVSRKLSFQEERPSIIKRIVKNRELRYIANLPENNENNHNQYKFVSMITTDGLYQLNQEVHAFRRILTQDQLKEIASILTNTIEIIERDGEMAYDDLTLDQLKRLEKAVRDHRGYTIIGYSINEEVFLNIVGAGQWEFPPEVEDYPVRVLNTINMPIVRDISVSLRSAAYSLIMFGYLVSAYLQYNAKNQNAYNNFYFNNVQWFLAVSAGITTLNLFLLRSGLFNKESVLSWINRLRLIEESIIGASANWTTYGALILPQPVIAYGIIPAMAYGFRMGRFDDDALYTMPVVNIANHTRFQTVWKGLSYSLTTGSFFSFGVGNLMFDILSSSSNDDASIFTQYNYDISMVQYSACAIALAAHLARYPKSSFLTQQFGRYSANISNTMGNVMLDNFAFFDIVAMTFGVTVGKNFSPTQTGLLAFFYGLQLVSFMGCFLTTFSTTPDLPEFSTEVIPPEGNLVTTCFEKIKKIKQYIKPISQSNNIAITELVATKPIGEHFRLFFSGYHQTTATYIQKEDTENPIHLTGQSV